LLATNYPIVAVISESMEHDGNFNQWWNSNAVYNGNPVTQAGYYANFAIKKDDFQKFSFINGFDKGDIMILVGKEPSKIKVGDVIVFSVSERNEPIIHRIIKIEKSDRYYFQTKGDHNEYSYPFESRVPEDAVIGKAVFKVPWFGYIKIGFLKFLSFFNLANY
jgi:fructose-1,6-bisphosphatase